jgi:hypothetical protein
MRKREGTERGEILNEDGSEIGWVKEIWKRKEGWKKSKKNLNLSNQQTLRNKFAKIIKI